MDTIPSAPPEKSNTITTTRQPYLEKRKKDEDGEWEEDNEKERSIEMKEMKEGNDDEQDEDGYEKKFNEPKVGAKSKKKAEFMDIHTATSPSSQHQPRELRPSNLPDQSNPKQHSKLPKEKRNVSPR